VQFHKWPVVVPNSGNTALSQQDSKAFRPRPDARMFCDDNRNSAAEGSALLARSIT
jgi:hypothetical protein